MSLYQQAPFCLATDGQSIFGTTFAYNHNLALTIPDASTYPDWLILTRSTLTQLPSAFESSPFYNASIYTQTATLNWTIIFSIPRVAVGLFPNISYAFSCGVSSEGYFAIRAQAYPDLQVQLAPSLLIRLPITNSTREITFNTSATGGLRSNEILDNDNVESSGNTTFIMKNEISDYSLPLLNLPKWTGPELQEPWKWYAQPGSATVLVAANDIVATNYTGDYSTGGGLTDPDEWVQIWSTCATDREGLAKINIQFAVSNNGGFPTTPLTTWELQVPHTLNQLFPSPFIH